MKIKFEKDVKSCKQCPLSYLEHDGNCSVYQCILIKGYSGIIPDEGFLEDCPIKVEDDDEGDDISVCMAESRGGNWW